ncbi:MAG: hypothetical protein CR966_01425, partial [Pseudomonadales bacterium]
MAQVTVQLNNTSRNEDEDISVMIKIETFKKHLSNPIALRQINFTYIGEEGKHLEQWKLNLSLVSLSEQYHQLEKVLGELLVANISDDKRIYIMMEMQPIIQRQISQLHSEYVHEPSSLNAKQILFVDQVKSIYYLCVLIFDGVLNRQIQLNSNKVETKKPKLTFKKLISSNHSHGNLIQQSIYFLMQNYLYLLMEEAIIFEKPSSILWQQLNSLYVYSIQENIANLKVSSKYHARHADTIHEYYLQCCLYSLLNPASYRRQDILSLHKVLDEWAKKVTIESSVKSESKIFIDLNTGQPPEYLTPYSKVNPYDENNICVFIFVDPLLEYLEKIQDTSLPGFKSSFEVRLAKLGEYTLKQQQFKLRGETRHPTREKAYAVIGLHRIHYHLCGKQPFGQLIDKANLPVAYHPKLRISLDMSDYEQQTPMIVLDKSTTGYRFKSTDKDVFESPSQATYTHKYSSLFKVLSLFAISPDPSDPNSTWELGMIRWIDHQENGIQAGAKIV